MKPIKASHNMSVEEPDLIKRQKILSPKNLSKIDDSKPVVKEKLYFKCPWTRGDIKCGLFTDYFNEICQHCGFKFMQYWEKHYEKFVYTEKEYLKSL